jgi:TonB family protein
MLPPAAAMRASLKPFLFASLVLHLLFAFLVPGPGVVRLIGSAARERSGSGAARIGSATEAVPFLPLGALRLQVLDIAIPGEITGGLAEESRRPATVRSAADPEPPATAPETIEIPRSEPPAPFLAEEASHSTVPVADDPAGSAGPGPLGEGGSGKLGHGQGSQTGSATGAQQGAGGGGGEGGVVVPPVIVAMAWPKYPRETRRLPNEPIVLAVHVTERGDVDGVRVENQSGCAPCERAAVESAWRLRCLPGTRDGKPIAMWITFPVTFGKR